MYINLNDCPIKTSGTALRFGATCCLGQGVLEQKTSCGCVVWVLGVFQKECWAGIVFFFIENNTSCKGIGLGFRDCILRTKHRNTCWVMIWLVGGGSKPKDCGCLLRHQRELEWRRSAASQIIEVALLNLKGSVSRELRWVLLYIIWKLFSMAMVGHHKILIFSVISRWGMRIHVRNPKYRNCKIN